jgi:hypothetical protein
MRKSELRQIIREEIKRTQRLNERVLSINAKFGGTAGENNMFFVGKKGLMKIANLSKDHPDNVFLVRDDNYSEFSTHYVKNGKFAKKTSANALYDLQRSASRLPKIESSSMLKAIVVM